MTMQNPERVVTKQDLKDFYDGIYPYLGGGSGGESIQILTMPTAGEEYLGKIVQYVGTTGTYTNGYFYECVSDGETPATYSWVAKNVQAGGSGGDLEDLGDVDITTPSNGDVLKYNSTSEKWENGEGGTVISELGDIEDVNLTSLADGQILKWDDTNSEWVNANESSGSSTLSGLTDTTISSPTDGQVLAYDNTTSKWVNSSAGGASDLDDLSDVALTTPTNGQVLKYDATTNKWVNAAESGGSTTVLTRTLQIGATSVTFSNIPTSGDYIVDFYTSNGINYTAINTATAGEVSLTFEAQEVIVTVWCEIKGV